jgi:hypothetical protein
LFTPEVAHFGQGVSLDQGSATPNRSSPTYRPTGSRPPKGDSGDRADLVVGHLQLDQLAPGLLPDPAATTTTMDQFKGWQVVGMVRETHEGTWPKQLEDLGSLSAMGSVGTRLGLGRCWERTGGSRKCHRDRDGREGNHCLVKFS